MAKKRLTAEQITAKLRAATVELVGDRTMGQFGRKLGVTGQTYDRLWKQCGVPCLGLATFGFLREQEVTQHV